MPNFFTDLNLDKVVYKINSLRKHYDIRKLYYMLSDSEDTLKLRRNIYSEIKRPDVFRDFCDFSDKMKSVREFLDYSAEVDFKPQKTMLFVSAANAYCDAVRSLLGLKGKLHTTELGNLTTIVEQYTDSIEYKEFFEKTSVIYSEIERLFYRLIIKRESFSVKESKSENDYFNKIKRAFPNAVDTGFESPFVHRKTLSHIETEAYSVLAERHASLFKACDEFTSIYRNFLIRDFVDLEFELQLYLSFYIFENYMIENGFGFSAPSVSGHLKAEGVYDIALALTLFSKEKPVIDNEVEFKQDESFIVVTGPNQGGKTTFARSIGQLIYFAMMGLDVAAAKAEIPYFNGILTHFSVEESTETGQGKLKEELTRLAPMMKQDDKNSFIILNELFTTAATYDAGIMGRRVMEHFVKNGCKGIYVTHIKELTAVPGTVSLVAVCDEEDYHKRLYKMVRKPADGFGYAEAVVEKHGLTYDMLLKRLEERGLLT